MLKDKMITPMNSLRTGRIGTYSIAKFDKEEEAVAALRSLRRSVKNGEWDATEFKERKEDS